MDAIDYDAEFVGSDEDVADADDSGTQLALINFWLGGIFVLLLLILWRVW